MKCLALKLFQTSGLAYKYYSIIFIFLFGALSSILLNKIYWIYVTNNDVSPKYLIVRRPFSILDLDDHQYFDTDQSAHHELIIRETEVEVVCK